MKFDINNPKHISEKWDTYIHKVVKVNSLLMKAYKIIEQRKIPIKNAFDIGCGPGNESSFLVKKGISVIAFDYNKKCAERIYELYPKLKSNKLFTFISTRIKNIEWKSVDLVVSIKVLPFLEKEIFYSTLEKIKHNLNPFGIVVLNFFGTEDEWQKNSLVSKNEIAVIFKQFEILYFEESIHIAKTVSGENKKNHLIELIARKK